MRKPLRSLVMAVLLLASACAGGQSGDGGGMRKPDAGQPVGNKPDASIADLIGGPAGNYQPARSLPELVEWSDVIAAGTLVSKRSDTIDGAPSITIGGVPTGSTNVTVVSMQVDRVLLGEPRSDLEINFNAGSVETSAESLTLPEVRALVFLSEWDPRIAAGADASELEPLYWLTTPQGLAIETSDHRVEEVFEPTHTLYGRQTNFDDLIEATESLARQQ